ncbi:hypothetical protein EYR41_012053 [Orbilia oligospora]|uniref:Uncharacterized protein n=1 Tax=Orbilia oligospora TaxID=2813651 RepID=A0A8H2DLX5_ORBOL|nr:hypothetical protein EYR41_012053 [Orbilia oligospora]
MGLSVCGKSNTHRTGKKERKIERGKRKEKKSSSVSRGPSPEKERHDQEETDRKKTMKGWGSSLVTLSKCGMDTFCRSGNTHQPGIQELRHSVLSCFSPFARIRCTIFKERKKNERENKQTMKNSDTRHRISDVGFRHSSGCISSDEAYHRCFVLTSSCIIVPCPHTPRIAIMLSQRKADLLIPT